MSAANVLKFIKEKEAEFVDLRFTDPRGKLQHLTMDVTIVDDEMLNDGVFFDGSSIAGWKAINESDMILNIPCANTNAMEFVFCTNVRSQLDLDYEN